MGIHTCLNVTQILQLLLSDFDKAISDPFVIICLNYSLIDLVWALFSVTEVITRDCLSSVVGLRTDIPADRYEGCRPAAFDPRLANYVNNSIKELDIKR